MDFFNQREQNYSQRKNYINVQKIKKIETKSWPLEEITEQEIKHKIKVSIICLSIGLWFLKGKIEIVKQRYKDQGGLISLLLSYQIASESHD